MALIKSNQPKEGEAFCKWVDSRFKHNKNVLGANLGPTGSGKSYRDLRMAELWYEYNFNEKFPSVNICFGIANVMGLLASGQLRKGEVIIFEEAGANLGSRDWSNKISKMFNYVLQSFRSMNVGIFFNLPYLSMLDSQARHLLHYSFESAGIDFKTGMNTCKPFFHQVNQGTGKIYKKYLRVVAGKSSVRMKRMTFSRPSQYLIDAYEEKKRQYLAQMTAGFSKQLGNAVEDNKLVTQRPLLSLRQRETYNLLIDGLTQSDIARKLKISNKYVSDIVKSIKKKGYLKDFIGNHATVTTINLQARPIRTPRQLVDGEISE